MYRVIEHGKVASTIVIELYRIITGSFLMISVPHSCQNDCRFWIGKSGIYTSAVVINTCTCLAFILMYCIEYKRELFLATNFTVESVLPSDLICKEYLHLTDNVHLYQSLDNQFKTYTKIIFIAMFFYIVNTVFTLVVLYNHDTTYRTFIVYGMAVLLIGFKMFKTIRIVLLGEEGICLSVYKENHVRYNNIRCISEML